MFGRKLPFVAVTALLAPLLFTLAANGQSKIHHRFPAPLFSVDAKGLDPDLGRILDFALSPDGARVAVAFDAPGEISKRGTWIAEWNTSDKTLIARNHIGVAIPPASNFPSIWHEAMQFTPDGSKLLVQVGDSLLAFDSDSVKLLYSSALQIEPLGPALENGEFSMSADGSAVAVLLAQNYDPPRTGRICVFNVESGKEIAHWMLPFAIHSLSLSPDGEDLLVSRQDPPEGIDLFVLNAASGREEARFASGFVTAYSMGATAVAAFLDRDHFLVTPTPQLDAKQNYVGDSLKILDRRTAAVGRQLTGNRFGLMGESWVSSRDQAIATLNAWAPHWKQTVSEDPFGPAEFLFFQEDRQTPSCVVGPLPKGQTKQTGYVRFSGDLRLVGLFFDAHISIYPLSACTVPSTS